MHFKMKQLMPWSRSEENLIFQVFPHLRSEPFQLNKIQTNWISQSHGNSIARFGKPRIITDIHWLWERHPRHTKIHNNEVSSLAPLISEKILLFPPTHNQRQEMLDWMKPKRRRSYERVKPHIILQQGVKSWLWSSSVEFLLAFDFLLRVRVR